MKTTKLLRPAPLTWERAQWQYHGDGLQLVIPVPPSNNKFYRRHGRFTHISKEGQQYKLGALQALWDCPKIDGDVEVHVNWYRRQASGDTDNFFKVVCDSLKDIAFGDDACIKPLGMHPFDAKVVACMVVTIVPYVAPLVLPDAELLMALQRRVA